MTVILDCIKKSLIIFRVFTLFSYNCNSCLWPLS